MYTPTYEEAYLCRSGKRTCEYGICDECSLLNEGESEEEKDEEQE